MSTAHRLTVHNSNSRHLEPAAQIGPGNGELSEPIAASLQRAVEALERFTEAANAPATLRGYRADWKCFTGWCERHGLDPLPAPPETVALYISDLAGVKSSATLRRRLTTISRAHDIAGLETPTRRAVVREAWKGIARSFGTASTAKTPARIDELRTIVGALDLDRLIGARDRALLVVGFAGALRRSELVALDVSDVSELADGLRVLIRRSKTDQEGAGYALGLPYGSDPLTCPVRSYRAWLEAAGIQSGPVFRPVTKGGALGLRRLSDRAVAEVVKRTALRVGLDPAGLAGHSLRSGLITSAAEAGVHERAIMRHSRHKSIPVMRRYIHEATLFTENAAAMVGL